MCSPLNLIAVSHRRRRSSALMTERASAISGYRGPVRGPPTSRVSSRWPLSPARPSRPSNPSQPQSRSRSPPIGALSAPEVLGATVIPVPPVFCAAAGSAHTNPNTKAAAAVWQVLVFVPVVMASLRLSTGEIVRRPCVAAQFEDPSEARRSLWDLTPRFLSQCRTAHLRRHRVNSSR